MIDEGYDTQLRISRGDISLFESVMFYLVKSPSNYKIGLTSISINKITKLNHTSRFKSINC